MVGRGPASNRCSKSSRPLSVVTFEPSQFSCSSRQVFPILDRMKALVRGNVLVAIRRCGPTVHPSAANSKQIDGTINGGPSVTDPADWSKGRLSILRVSRHS